GWRLLGDVTTSLNLLARALYSTGLAGEWRSEQLAVHDQFDHFKGTVERAAVRPLGISTAAVHLAGQTPDGRHWVQQRSMKKSNDPGLWDTLMGGMVSAADTVETALERETWEEAGLKLAQLQNVTYGGRILTRRPTTDGKGTGYVIEDVDWYRCTVPDDVVPQNQDGEVAQFALMDSDSLLQSLQRNEFTTEAALILSEVLGLQA
ncbi:MAG: NUDIX domain-containing protein, partial [Polaromonas sp.]